MVGVADVGVRVGDVGVAVTLVGVGLVGVSVGLVGVGLVGVSVGLVGVGLVGVSVGLVGVSVALGVVVSQLVTPHSAVENAPDAVQLGTVTLLLSKASDDENANKRPITALPAPTVIAPTSA